MADRHDAHDLAPIVAFADGEVAGPELEAATTQVQDCMACAQLVADLRSLALADRRLSTPVRPRDFRLTPADVERLGRLGPEPLVTATRLGHDMTGTPATHRTHDLELIAAAVDGLLEEPERRTTDAWLATCAPCAELHADLLAIASAERAMPIPTRPRDFRLTPADAHRLRPRGLRAILAAIGSSRDAFSKPLAVGLTTLGLAGLLVGTVPSLGLSGATSLSTVGAAVERYGDGTSGAPDAMSGSTGDGTVFGGQDAIPSSAPSAAAAAGPGSSAAASGAPQPAPESAAALASEAPRDAAGTPAGDASTGDRTTLSSSGSTDEAARLAAAAEGPSPLLVASIVMLVAGIGLFAARWSARRLRGT